MQPWKGSSKSKDAKTCNLQQEALDMESKLMGLRMAMEKEREKREAIIAGAVQGSLWKNGSAGLLRGNFRAKHGKEAGASPDASSATAPRIPSGRSDAISAATRMPSGRSGASSGAASPGRVNTPSRERGAAGGSTGTAGSRSLPAGGARTPPAAMQPSMDSAGVSGSRINAQAVPAAAAAAKRAPLGFGGGSSGRAADVLAIEHGDYDDHDDGGMACGTEPDPDDLMGGGFNEGDSHRSFLEALNAWRNGSKGAETVVEDSGMKASTSGRSASARPSSAAPSAPIECQTDARQPLAQRPQSASASSKKTSTYFGKLVLSANSRHAGQAAGGQASALDSRPGSSGGRLPLPPSSTSGARSTSKPAAESGGMSDLAPHVHEATVAEASSSANTKLDKGMDMLARLEALEQKQKKQGHTDDDDEDVGVAGALQTAEVSNAKGLGLTKGTRLPDAIFVPGAEDDSDEV